MNAQQSDTTVATRICSCHWIKPSTGGEHAELCSTHDDEYQAALVAFQRWPRIIRWFDSEGDARDLAGHYENRYQGPYWTKTAVSNISGRWLMLAHWYELGT